MKNVKMTICLMAAVLFMVTGQGLGGTVYFNDGGTYNINYLILNDVDVSLSTTVNWLEDGRVESPFEIQVSSGSKFNMYGGIVGDLQPGDTSQVTISGGLVWIMSVRGSKQVTISGGNIANYLDINWSSQVVMSGGWVRNLYAYDNSQTTMSGGAIGESIHLSQQAILTIDGSNFAIDGTPFSSGEITSIFGGGYSNDPFRTLTGVLANGDIINNQFQLGDYAKIVLVPEPATLLLLGLGAAILKKGRRK
jgi:hypothetical protein